MEVPTDIMAKYIERRKQDFKDCLSSFEQHEYGELEKVGHQLKGNGATFGHPELTTIGTKLELAAREQDNETLKVALKEFSDWVNNHD